ncbi:hypothetical protein Q7C36_005192 [Tachysurus vachellii]|uniref:Uncharacterized protein n=1 Tax=Tachysurus vachellii TaxID=175792 RepID=A0AA88NLR5_TACVA|nr:hypothetical protein Q7C36_005192 [Tachysurus vachellii]
MASKSSCNDPTMPRRRAPGHPRHGSLQELSPSSIGNACTKKAVGPQAASKVRCALAGSRTRASRAETVNCLAKTP